MDHTASRDRARRLLERVFLSESFVEYLSKARPDFALKVVDVETAFFSERFVKLLFVSWLRNPNSVIYEETLNNQNQAEHHRYKYTPLNPVVWYFFGGPFKANLEATKMYKPVGDFVCDELRRRGRSADSDRYRRPNSEFSSGEKWRCPIHISLRLFDFWISEGLHRGIHWHGWLMYVEYWVDGILANMAELGPEVDHSREYPTPYHYLLYDIVVAIGYWIEDATKLEQTLPSVRIDAVNMTWDNIGKSAVIALGRCLRSVIESSNLTVEFKAYLLAVVLRGYEHVVDIAPMKQMYEMSVLRGGGRHGDDALYRTEMRATLPIVDRDPLYFEPGGDLYEQAESYFA